MKQTTQEPNDAKSLGYVVNGITYCKECGNLDCPNVSSDPFWSRCPEDASRRYSVELLGECSGDVS